MDFPITCEVDENGWRRWGVSLTSSNPKPDEHIACASKEDAERLNKKLTFLVSGLCRSVECSILERDVLPSIESSLSSRF